MIYVENAPAKINLALHVRSRRPDGYHELETLFAFTEYGDKVSLQPGSGLKLSIVGPFSNGLNCGADNLVLRAVEALRIASDQDSAEGHIVLEKNLPVASGIGGGSADAAATLRLLNRYWGLNWPLERLAALGATLGADIPACVWSCPSLGYGKGDALEIIHARSWENLPILLINPGIAVATAPMFSAWDGKDRGALDSELSVSSLVHQCRNDLERGATKNYPIIATALSELAQTQPLLSRMSGSGATCFALYATEESCFKALDIIKKQHPHWWAVASNLQSITHNR